SSSASSSSSSPPINFSLGLTKRPSRVRQPSLIQACKREREKSGNNSDATWSNRCPYMSGGTCALSLKTSFMERYNLCRSDFASLGEGYSWSNRFAAFDIGHLCV